MLKRQHIQLLACVIGGTLLVTACGELPGSTDAMAEQPNNQAKPTDKPGGKEPAGQPVLSKSEYILPPGASQPLEVTLSAGGGARPLTAEDGLTFASSAPQLVDVDETGVIRVSPQAKTGDSATITVTAGTSQLTCEVKIKQSLQDTVTVDGDGTAVVTNADEISVVVNKKRNLPSDYRPKDLVEPDVPFSFSEKSEKRLMRAEAAKALEDLFRQADKDNIQLYGVSGYRSYNTQKSLFNYYVKVQGEEEARKYSALPGQSEHQTGLAIDVSSESANFALEESFASTAEGKWLAENVAEFGFIIRYPQGKEHITGYNYEPWHIRYVGKEIAREIADKEITLEQYFDDVIPVSK